MNILKLSWVKKQKIMKRYTLLIIIAFALFLSACNENRVYEKHRKNFTEYNWEKSKVLEFSPTIENINAEYQIYFAFRYIYGFPQEKIDINVEITSPSGVITNTVYTAVLRDGTNEYGVCAGDYCDLEHLLEDNYKFQETGTYTFKVSQLTNEDPLQWVMEVGLIIDIIPIEK